VGPDDRSHIYAGSMSYMGLIEIQNNEYFAKYDQTNSSLQEMFDKPGVVAITDMAFDDDGNLWMCNMKCDKQLVVRTKSGSWGALDLGNEQNVVISRIAIDHSGFKWVVSPGKGIWVYDDNGTISNSTDDQVKLLTNNIGN